MAHTTVESGHVAVSLLIRLFTKKTQAVFKLVTDTLSGILFGIISVRSVVYAQNLKESGEVSMTMQLPFHPFVYLLAFSAFAVMLVFLIAILEDIKEVISK
jgi:TRAP-type C4-dicarboxylate transport system permease small subunit